MQVHLGGHLSWYDPLKRSSFELHVGSPIALSALIEQLGLPSAEIAITAINGGVVESKDMLLSDEDRVDILPPVGGGRR